jgi:cardiolipin synthase A/B
LPVLFALESAALRGVRVRLVVPRRTDNKLVDLAMPHFFEPVLRAGVTVAYRPGPMLHMKMMLVDGDLAILGSSNMDTRSFFLNFESDLVVYGGPFQTELLAVAEAEWSASELFTAEDMRKTSIPRRLAYRSAALFSTIL